MTHRTYTTMPTYPITVGAALEATTETLLAYARTAGVPVGQADGRGALVAALWAAGALLTDWVTPGPELADGVKEVKAVKRGGAKDYVKGLRSGTPAS